MLRAGKGEVMTVHVLLADKFPEERIDDLRRLKCEVTYDQSLKEDSLLEALRKMQPDILIVRSTLVNGDMIRSDPNLNLIIRAGSGYNTIDVDTASERSVYVSNCPGKNAVAVAELAFGLILGIDRRIPDNVMQLREGRWNKKEFSKARGVYGRTLGVVGVGRIGNEVIARAKAFGMPVIAWSRSLTEDKARILGIGYCGSPGVVASHADIISVHLALTSETRNMIGEDFFNKMKPGAYFINTSRAEIVDEGALLRAVDEKGLHVGLDVFTGEPEAKTGEIKHSLAGHPLVYGTHHIGASTDQAQLAVADETVRIVREYLSTGHAPNCVNLLARTPARWMISVHHRNRVGILAGILDEIRDAGINVEIMENLIFTGDEGACARIQLDGELSEENLIRIKESSGDIFSVSQVELGR
jgi:D-3-phosphoglycerate dehydrogenase